MDLQSSPLWLTGSASISGWQFLLNDKLLSGMKFLLNHTCLTQKAKYNILMFRKGTLLESLFSHVEEVLWCDNKFIQRWCLEIHLLGADGVSFYIAVDTEAIFFGVAIGIATTDELRTQEPCHHPLGLQKGKEVCHSH